MRLTKNTFRVSASRVITRRNISFEDSSYKKAKERSQKLAPYVKDFSHYLNILMALDAEHGFIETYFIQKPNESADSEKIKRLLNAMKEVEFAPGKTTAGSIPPEIRKKKSA